MKRLAISTSLAIQNEIRRSAHSRYDHRLQRCIAGAEGLSCPEAARSLGDVPRAVEYWEDRSEAYGLAGLREGRRWGRPSRLGQVELKVVQEALRQSATLHAKLYGFALSKSSGRSWAILWPAWKPALQLILPGLVAAFVLQLRMGRSLHPTVAGRGFHLCASASLRFDISGRISGSHMQDALRLAPQAVDCPAYRLCVLCVFAV